MPISELRFIKRCDELCTPEQIRYIPHNTRGIYALLCHQKRSDKYDVVYIGMARGKSAGIASRLRSHLRKKRGLWTHFSIYEVWDNITESEIAELEGLFRHIYRKDTNANLVNQQRSFKKLKRAKRKLHSWE